MMKIYRKIFSFTMIVLTLFVYIASPIKVEAATDEPQTLGDLKGQLAALKKQKADNDKKTQSAKDQIAANEREIDAAEKAITEAEAGIEEAQLKIEDSNVKIAELKVETEKVLRIMQQLKGQNAYVEYLSGASSMTELVMRLAAIDQITAYNQKTLDNLDQLIKDNEQLKKDLQKEEEELNNKIVSYQATIKKLYGNLESYDKFALDIDTQIKTVQENVNAYVKLCAASPKSYLGDNELLTDCSNVPYNAGWLKPLNKGTVTSRQGYRTHPVTGAKYSFHSGIDIGRNSEGTKIYAAAAGTVSGIVRKYKCGGNMVYVNVTVGGVKYTTYYYHLKDINVKVGQVVTQSTVIGTVGGYSTSRSHGGYDSCTTGAHLHFGVAKGYFSGNIPTSKVIVPPGFRNAVGYSFSSRTDYYG